MISKLNTQYNDILKKYFGHNSLKKEQFEIIYNLINKKKDVCAILATGYGKSLCYQLPLLITNKSVIVVSPLISLMKDQRMSMERLNIPVCCFNSDHKFSEKLKHKTNILNGNHSLIYMTPEYLMECEDFIKELSEDIALVCIDEAHCISSWGNDFRQSYSKLNIIKEWIPNVPVLAVTATASSRVRNDICKLLSLENPVMIIGTFDRPNLYIKISVKGNSVKTDLSDLLEKFKNEYIIIYCKTREDTEKTALVINELGILCFAYHAGLSNSDRDTIQTNFNNGLYKCIVATIAFGMGINVPNIRLVVHYSCPKNLESYYQEIGRAGRDGKNSECHLFYSIKDFILNRFFIKDIKNVKYREYQEQEIRNIQKYVYTTECRRKILLNNFGENMISCNNCDNCKKKIILEKSDFTVQSHKILSLISLLKGKFGRGIYINILRGSTAKNVSAYRDLEAYDSGKDYSTNFLKALIRILINNEYLQETQIAQKFGSTIECTKKSLLWLERMSKYQEIVNIDEKDKLIFVLTDEIKLYIKSNKFDNKSDKFDNKSDKLDNKSDKLDNKSDKLDNKSDKLTNKSNNKKNDHSRWDNEQEQQLLDNIALGKKRKELSEILGRTNGAILSRLKYIAYKLHKEGKPLNEIIAGTKLSEQQINDAIIWNTNKINSKIKKNNTDTELNKSNKSDKLDKLNKSNKSDNKSDNKSNKSNKSDNKSNKSDNKSNKSDNKSNKSDNKSNDFNKWNSEQEQKLLDNVASGKKIKDISEILGKTRTAILSRLKYIAYKLHTKGKSLEEIIKISKLSEYEIEDAIITYNNKKKIVVRGKQTIVRKN